MIVCIFHKWDKWEEYQSYLPPRMLSKKWGFLPAVEYRQKRKCKKCGKIQDKLIRTELTRRVE